jgi:hypothetical protein
VYLTASALRGTFGTTLTKKYDKWKLSDIVTESTMFILEKKVTFQGIEIQTKNLFRESDFCMLSALTFNNLGSYI